MRRLWWWVGSVGGVAVLTAGVLAGTGFPGRSDFLAERAPQSCVLITEASEQPFGAITSCIPLGRRTPLFGGADGTAFVLVEAGTGPVSVRIDYTRTGDGWTADAVEIGTWVTPGINADPTAKRLNEAVGQRGGLRPGSWRLRP